jgi:hypothetical protein
VSQVVHVCWANVVPGEGTKSCLVIFPGISCLATFISSRRDNSLLKVSTSLISNHETRCWFSSGPRHGQA